MRGFVGDNRSTKTLEEAKGIDSEMGDVIRLSAAFSDPVTPRFLHFYPIRRTEANEGTASEPD